MKNIYLAFLLAVILTGCKSSILTDPTTEINYSVPVASHVRLTVENNYNTLVATLVDTVKSPGNHSVIFNTHNVAEGVYYYTIEFKGVNNNFYLKTTKTMLLVK